MKIEIQKNVPVTGPGPGRPVIYPWSEMEVGDSFMCEPEKVRSATAAASKLGYSVRTSPAEGGMVWMTRVAKRSKARRGR